MRWTAWVAFAVLCILAGTSWVIPEMMGDGLPPLERLGILFGAIGLCALVFAIRRVGLGGVGKLHVRVALAGVGVFGVSDVVAEYSRGSVPSFSRSALYAMVPVVVIMAVAAGDSRWERGAGGEEVAGSGFGWAWRAVVVTSVAVFRYGARMGDAGFRLSRGCFDGDCKCLDVSAAARM